MIVPLRLVLTPLLLSTTLTLAPGWAHAHAPASPPSHPSADPAPAGSHRPPYPVRFEGLTLGQTLSTVPACAPDGSTKTLCYASSFDGMKAPDLSPSVHTVVLQNLPAFLPPVPAGHTPPTALETDRQHRGLASVVDGRIEEIKIMVPESRAREAAALLVKHFPRTVLDEDDQMLIGENYAIGFGDAPGHVVIAVVSRVFIEALKKDEAAAPGTNGPGGLADPDHAPKACPIPGDGSSV